MQFASLTRSALALVVLLACAPLAGAQTTSLPLQDDATPELFIPPPPLLDSYPSSTMRPSVVLSGISPNTRDVQISGPFGSVLSVTTAGGAFSESIPLEPNMVNHITLRGITFQGVFGKPRSIAITQDMAPPAVFLDYPADGEVISTSTTAVAGRVSDLLSGFMGLTVEVNGMPADVNIGIGTNGTFLVKDVPLTLAGPTVIQATATDALGNVGQVEITVTQADASGPSMVISGGDGQIGVVGSTLGIPMEIHVTKTGGADFAGKTVTFEVIGSDGVLRASPGGAGSRVFQAQTDATGRAQAYYTLGGSAGCGNNRIRVTSKDIAGTILLCHTAEPAPPSQINVGRGNRQRGEVGGLLVEPLETWVSDSCNGVENISVTYTVVQGGGKVNGFSSINVFTGPTGHAQVEFTVGETPGLQVVRADYPGNPGSPVVFYALGLERVLNGPTSFKGSVFDNANRPLEGATVRLDLGNSSLQLTTDADGRFCFEDIAQSGPGELYVFGSTVTEVGGTTVPLGSFPSLHYMVLVTPNTENSLAAPVLLPPLDPANLIVFDNVKDEVLRIDGVEGLEMVIKAGSMTLADGTVPSALDPVLVSLNQVHHDDIPMPMPNGVAPPFAWTLQPGGATFDPPVEIRYPNMTGLPPGAASYFLSYDHDMERFDIVATGTVSADGSTIVSDPGTGILKAGWGCNCPPYSVTGDCEDCEPDSNGCGSGWNEPFVPDGYTCFIGFIPVGTASWSNGSTDACDIHDFCYGICASCSGKSKADCDTDFLNDMAAACDSAFFGGAFTVPCYLNCMSRAALYYLAVHWAADSAYAAGQDAACMCDDCGGDPMAGGSALSKDDVYTILGITPPLDTDGDLLDDDWEIANGLNPAVPDDIWSDDDGDLLALIHEYGLGFDPFDPDSDDDLETDYEEVLAVNPVIPPTVGEGWQVSVAGQVVETGPFGVFTLENISAADQFGPGGPGSAPDFLADDPVRLVAVGEIAGEPYYAFSDFFQITDGQTFSLPALTVTDIPPISPVSLDVSVAGSNVLTTVGETTQLATIATLSDGTMQDVTPHLAWTTYLTSNTNIATVDQDGLVTAQGKGIAYLTAKNDAATAVTAVLVSPGDPLTTVEGFVLDDLDAGVAGVDVRLTLTGTTVQTDAEGFFTIPGIPSDLGQLTVVARVTSGNSAELGLAVDLTPVPDGVTDAGVIRLEPAVFWAVDADGSWNDPANWNTNAVPTATDNVVISRSAGAFTIDHDLGANACMNLFCEETLEVNGGTLTLGGTAVADGTLHVDGGTLAGGVVQVTGAFELQTGRVLGTHILPGSGGQGPTATGNTCILDGVRMDADLEIPNGRYVYVENGLELNGTARLQSTGSTTQLWFQNGDQTLSGTGTVLFEGTSTNSLVRSQTGSTLTIGNKIHIEGTSGTVGNVSTPLINQGVITSNGGGTIIVTGAGWVNECILSATDSSTLTTAGSWSNSADISVASDGVLNLGGTYSTGGIGALDNGGGEINFTGALDNVGSSLFLDGSTGTFRLNGGSITGGTVTTVGGAVLDVAGSSSNRLLDLTFNGDLVFGTTSARLRMRNPDVNGTIRLAANGSNLAFEGDTTFDSGTISFESPSGVSYVSMQAAGTLTLGPGATIVGGRGQIGSGNWWAASMTLVNDTTIDANVSGTTVFLNPQTSLTNNGAIEASDGAQLTINSTWSNVGTLLAQSGGILNLGGNFTTAGLGTVSNVAGVVNLTGALDNSSATLTLDGGTGSWNLSGGSITGGVVDLTGGAQLAVLANSNNRLIGVTLNGDLLLTASASRCRLLDPVVNGTIRLQTSGSNISFEGDSSFTGTISYENPTGTTYVSMYAAGTLTLTPGSTIEGGRGRLGTGNYWAQSMTLVNDGLIRANTTGDILVNPQVSTANAGTMEARDGASLTIDSAWSNAGTLHAENGGILNLDGTFTSSGLGTQTNVGGVVNLTGACDNTASTLTLDGGTGSWNLLAGSITGGTLDMTGGAMLEILASSNNRLLDLTINGDLSLDVSGARLRMRNPVMNGTVHIVANGSNLAFEGDTTWNSGTISFENTAGTSYVSMYTAGTLTIGPGGTVEGGRGRLGTGNYWVQSMTLVNDGLIRANTAGDLLVNPQISAANSGTVEARDGASLTLNTAWSSTGTLHAENGGILNLGGSFTTSGIGTQTNVGGVVNLTGACDNTGSTLTLDGGTGSWNLLGGSITGGVLDQLGGAMLAIGSSSNNRLLSLTVNGDLTLNSSAARLRVDDLVMNGTVHLAASSANLAFEGDNAWNSGSISFENPTGTSYVSMQTAGTLTIGPGGTLEGGRGRIGTGSYFAQSMTLVNDGTITGDGAGTFTFNPVSVTNSGTITADGVTMTIPTLTNLASGFVVALNSASLTLNGTWSNAGTISTTDSTLALGGSFATADYGTVSNTNSTVNLTGNLDNTGATFALTGGTGSWNLLGGTITGGTLDQTGGAVLNIGGNSNNRIVDCAVLGDLALTVAGARLRVSPGTTVSGTVRLGIGGSNLAFEGSTTWNQGTISFENPTGTSYVSMQSAGTLTLGPSGSIVGGRGQIGTGNYWAQQMAFVNDSTITADVAGGQILVNAQNGTVNNGTFEATTSSILDLDDLTNTATGLVSGVAGSLVELRGDWSNAGSIDVTGATLDLYGNFTTAGTGSITNSGSTVNIRGNLDNTGATLALDGATGSWNLIGGVITGGNVTQTGGALLRAGSNSNNRLVGVALSGDLVLDQSGSRVRLSPTTTVAGTVRLAIGGSNVAFEGDTTWNGDISFENPTGTAYVSMQTAGTLTLGASGSITGGRGRIGNGNYWAQQMAFVNDSTITADVAGGQILVNAQNGTVNNGTFEATTSSTLDLEDLTNTATGLVSGVAGSLVVLRGDWSNAGSIDVTGATLDLYGNFTTAGTGSITNSGSTVNIRGNLDNTGATLALDGATGSWNLLGGVITGGNVTQTGGALLRAGSSSSNRLVGVALSGDLVLDQSGSRVRLSPTTTVAGTVRLAIGGSNVAFEGDTTWNGDISFENPTSTSYVSMQTAGTLTLGASGSITGGRGRIGNGNYWAQQMTLVNDGTITADAGHILLNPQNGTTSNGTLEIAVGSELEADTALVQAAGIATIDGTLDQDGAGGLFDVTGGTVEGTGDIAGNLRNAGTLRPGGSAGVLTVTGTYEQTSAGTLEIELGGTTLGTDYDQLSVGGVATLDGTLDVVLINTFTPVVADSFDGMAWSSSSGTFGTVNVPDLGGDTMTWNYLPTTLQLLVQ